MFPTLHLEKGDEKSADQNAHPGSGKRSGCDQRQLLGDQKDAHLAEEMMREHIEELIEEVEKNVKSNEEDKNDHL